MCVCVCVGSCFVWYLVCLVPSGHCSPLLFNANFFHLQYAGNVLALAKKITSVQTGLVPAWKVSHLAGQHHWLCTWLPLGGGLGGLHGGTLYVTAVSHTAAGSQSPAIWQ